MPRPLHQVTKMLVNGLAFAVLLALPLCAAQDAGSAVHGTVTKLDSASKTAVVKTKDGTEETVHFAGRTTVRGVAATETGTKDAFHGLKEGDEVVVHYTAKGTEKTAVEVDKVGKTGLKAVEGTVTTVGKDGKTVVVKTADGTEETFKVAGEDTGKAAKDLGKGAGKAGKVTVYYTESAGKKVAHFFEKL